MTKPRRSYNPDRFPPFAVTVDIVLLTIRQGRLAVLLVKRGVEPFKDSWALPGGFVREDESLDVAALRELREESAVGVEPAHLEQLATYGQPDRDPRMRVVTVAYLGIIPEPARPVGGSDAAAAHFWAVDDLEAEAVELAFDHESILQDGIERARSKLEYTTLATAFLEEPFTISDVRHVYEAVWSMPLHAANFRRKLLSANGAVIPTGDERATGRGWAGLYRRGTTTELHPPIMRG